LCGSGIGTAEKKGRGNAKGKGKFVHGLAPEMVFNVINLNAFA
jgi:hypothetical protein